MKSPLGSRAPREPMSADELHATAGVAWRKRGWVAIHVDAIVGDDWFKQAVINYANKLYGGRE